MKNFLITLSLLVFTTGFSQDLSVEKIWKNYEYFGAGVAGFRSMNDGLHYSKISKNENSRSIVKYSFSDPTFSETIVDLSSLKTNEKSINIDDYEFNADETKILFTTNTKSIYRRSFTADYLIYDLKSKELAYLDEGNSPQLLATYSPDGTKVAYIHENNIYVKDIVKNKVKQCTKDGLQNSIINGTTDWVYEEEFAITQGFGWSPDSKHIAFLRFDESKVKEFTMTYFSKLYPDLYTFKYPKAGEDNSIVTVNILNVKSGKSKKVDLGEYEYIPRLKWSSSENKLILQTLNRHQNEVKYHMIVCQKGKWTDKVFYEETDEAYVEIDDNLLILDDGKNILRTSEKNGFNHIYQLGFDGTIKPITTGKWDVIEFLGVDEVNKKVYYTSSEKGAIHQGIYSISLDGTGKTSLSSETGNNRADFSKGMKYFVKSYSNANTPAVYSLCDNTGKEIRVIEDNQDLKDKINKLNPPKKEFFNIMGAEKELNAWMIKPADFDPNKTYPVYINIYGGPGSNMVKDTWGGLNHMYHLLLAQEGYIVVSVDPRGTMYRGAEFKKSTYLELGKLETEDFIAVAKNLGKKDFVDSSRIGIQGWSYGGFMTSLCMTKGNGTFKMGIAVAPVTNWRYYDNIYTERFMRTPAENKDGYDKNSPINFVNQLQGKYLLIHGSADDNVHHQNTMEMINALVSANKQFDLFVYPNKNHGIFGGNTRNHLFNMLLDYTKENL